MIDLIKKTLLTGVGLAVMTKEKVEELGRDLASQAELSEKEGRELVDNLLKQSEAARDELDSRVGAIVKRAIEGLNLAHRDEVAKLQSRVDALAAELETHRNSNAHNI